MVLTKGLQHCSELRIKSISQLWTPKLQEIGSNRALSSIHMYSAPTWRASTLCLDFLASVLLLWPQLMHWAEMFCKFMPGSLFLPAVPLVWFSCCCQSSSKMKALGLGQTPWYWQSECVQVAGIDSKQRNESLKNTTKFSYLEIKCLTYFPLWPLNVSTK